MAHTAKLLIRDVVTAAKTETVIDVARKMKKAGIGCIVVTEGGRPVGVFSERDLLNRVVSEGKDPSRIQIAQAMTPDPVTVDAAQPLDKVFSLLAEGRFRHLPITESGRLVGIVSLTDLAKVLKEVYAEDKYLQYFADYMQVKSAA